MTTSWTHPINVLREQSAGRRRMNCLHVIETITTSEYSLWRIIVVAKERDQMTVPEVQIDVVFLEATTDQMSTEISSVEFNLERSHARRWLGRTVWTSIW